MAKTYWIARVDLHGDPETYKKYVETAKPAFERHKARFMHTPPLVPPSQEARRLSAQ